jgi:peptide/nickel transport system substrate-binding protein
MKLVHRVIVVLVSVAVLLMPLAVTDAQEPRRGGILTFALQSEGPTLDPHATTALVVSYTMHHVFETLFTINSKLEPVPMLAEGYTTTPDRRTYTITLRKGVPFHHGREMTSEDVVASLTRWGRMAVRGRALFANVESLTAPNPHTIVFKLKDPYALLIADLAWWTQFAAIYPKEVVDEVGTGPLRRYIGTGPFRFVEHVPDRHLRLERFDRYAARAEPPDGMSGRRIAYLDGITFVPVPDTAVRVAGVQRNDYQFGELVSADDYDRLRRDPNATPFRGPVPSFLAFVLNKRTGPTTNVKVRQALLAALDAEAIMKASYGHSQFYRLDSSLMPKEHYMWTDAGKEFYNQKNPERARQLLAEAGYRGEPIRFLVTAESLWALNSANVAKPMLERAGFTVDLQLMDWATVLTRRARPEGWEAMITTFTAVPDPTFLLVLSPTFPGWYESRDMQAILTLMRRHTDPKVRMDLWRRAQVLFWTEVPTVKLGDGFFMHVHRPELKGYVGLPSHYFWNTWLEPRR